MDIQSIIDTLLVNSEEIRKAYPTVTNVRHEIMDIPFSELKQFAQSENRSIHIDDTLKKAYIIHSPINKGKIDTDIWLYSIRLKIQPSIILEDNGEGDAY